MTEKSLAALLIPYAVMSFTYALMCGVIGNRYDPLSAFAVYAVGCAVAFLISLAWYRPKRIWPPTVQEGHAALSSTLILTSSTLSLMLPQSLLAVVTSKSGALLLPSISSFRRLPRLWRKRRDLVLHYFARRLALPLLAVLAVILAAWRKPLVLVIVPFVLAVLYIVGYGIKLQSVKLAKKNFTERGKTEFTVAEQLVVAVATLAIAALFSQMRLLWPDAQHRPVATMADWRLWLVAMASYGGGFIGTKLVLHSTPQTVVFPAYRAMSLVCALGASAARGELKLTQKYLTDWLAIGVALIVVLWASGAFRVAFRSRWARWTGNAAYRGVSALRGAAQWLRMWFGLWLVTLPSQQTRR